MTDKKIDTGFAPIVGHEPRILVLGTMPSVASLESQQYYGHPRNAFWWIMSQICGFNDDLSYEDRVIEAKKSKVAIWDVIESCHRPGSLDSAIDQSSLKPNDIQSILEMHPSIRALCFNGQAAHKLFVKHLHKSFVANLEHDIHILPSTSPANAAMSRENKLEKWLIIESYLR